MGGTWTQLFPGKPGLTEEDVPSLAGRVYIVTGGNAGIGLDVVKILYAKGGKVYIAGRSPDKITIEIEALKKIATSTPGQLEGLHVDLADLTSVAPCANSFLAKESRLDVLFNNAGTAQNPVGSTSVQGYEAHMGTNCLGPYLLTKLLLPVLIKTAKDRDVPRSSVRVIWTSSGIVDLVGPPGGVTLENQAPGKHVKDKNHNYSASKAGNWLLASELDKRIRKDGMVSVAQHPGTLKTKGWERAPFLMRFLMSPFMHDPKMGAYTTLWAALSPDVTVDDGGRFGIPWGRWHPDPRKDVLESLKSKDEGGTGLAAQFWDWCDNETKPYAGY